MLKVGPFLKFLSDLNPQNNPARLALSNWLRGFASPDEPLDRSLVEKFFWDALDYPHWAGNRGQLGQEIRFAVGQFNNFYQQKFDLSNIRTPESLQIIEIEHNHDMIEALSCHLNQMMNPDDKFRIVAEPGNKKFVAVILRADRSLEVRSFDRKFTLRGGILEPLRRDLAVFYTPQLELSEQHQHRIEVAPYITAQFTIDQGRVQGVMLRGFVFQRMHEMKGELLAEIPRLNLPLKRLEQFFIDRRTDKEYQDLLQKLERTRALLQAGDAEARRWAPTILTHAESALEQVYAGDRLLTLLIRDLRHILPPEVLKQCATMKPTDLSDSTN